VVVRSVGLSVCLSVPLVTTVYFGGTAEEIELPFGVVGRVRPRYHVLDGATSSPREGAILGWTLRPDLFSNYLNFYY